jgi:ATP dependent DNA ligase domain
MSILQILEAIGSDTKRSHKLSLIEQHKGNTQFLQVVSLALDPYKNFYIRKIPAYDPKGKQTLDWALAELEKLSSRELTGGAGIEHLRSVLGSLTTDDATVVERIIGKDLRCGVADGIVNAVLTDFVPTYPCLLARPYDDKNIKNINYPAHSQLKADGLRVNLHTNGRTVSICGRSGRDIDLLGLMDAEVAELGSKFPVPVVFDGELVVVDKNGKILSRKIGNGIINKAIKGTISAEEAKMVRAQLWDVIPADEFRAGISKKPYSERFKEISDAIASLMPVGAAATFAALRGNTMKYWVIPSKVVNSLTEAEAHFQELLAAGEEGTILKNFCGLWEDTRSKHLVKFKAERECDLEIIGWNPGQGQFDGMVGSLIVASSDRQVEASISGFDVPTRQWITDNINTIMGGIVAVMYNERIGSKDKNRVGVDSLFLPRYIEFRNDKTVADTSKEIK